MSEPVNKKKKGNPTSDDAVDDSSNAANGKKEDKKDESHAKKDDPKKKEDSKGRRVPEDVFRTTLACIMQAMGDNTALPEIAQESDLRTWLRIVTLLSPVNELLFVALQDLKISAKAFLIMFNGAAANLDKDKTTLATFRSYLHEHCRETLFKYVQRHRPSGDHVFDGQFAIFTEFLDL